MITRVTVKQDRNKEAIEFVTQDNIQSDRLVYKVINNTQKILPLGTILYSDGIHQQTGRYLVKDVATFQNEKPLGISIQNLIPLAQGVCIYSGMCKDIVDTSQWSEGTILYPDNSGGLSDIPQNGGDPYPCARVELSSVDHGVLFVRFVDNLEKATVNQAGIVQLDDSLNSNSTTKAATANAVKQLEDKKADKTELHTPDILGTKSIDEATIGDGKVIQYDGTSDKLVYTDTFDFGTI